MSEVISYVVITNILMLFLAFFIIWFYALSKNRIFNAELKEQKLRLSYSRDLIKNTLDVQEEEKKKISMELHDSVSSELNLLLLKVRQFALSPCQTEISDIESGIYHCSELVRNISHMLTPVYEGTFNLASSLLDIKSRVELNSSISITYFNVELGNFEDNLKNLHLFRIIQELCNNALKHSQATKLLFQFYLVDDNKLFLKYTDNGIGLESNAAMKSGLGLKNIRSRLEALNSKMEIEKSLDSGLVILFYRND